MLSPWRPPPLQLDAYPRAPQLFTALLQQAGVAPELLPLLAEPARNAVQVRWWPRRCLPPPLPQGQCPNA